MAGIEAMDWYWIIVFICAVLAIALVKIIEVIGKFAFDLFFIFTQIEEDEYPHRPTKDEPSPWEM